MALVRLCSYNMHGFYNGIDFVSELLDTTDIFCLQEHWLRPDSLSLFNNVSPEFSAISLSSMTVDNYNNVGRPFGGLTVLYRTSVVKLLHDYGQCINNRVSGILLLHGNSKILLFNVYFPCVGDFNLRAEVDIISGYMNSVIDTINLDNVTVLMAGDFNTDLLHNDSADMSSLFDIFDRHKLQPCTKSYQGVYKYTYRVESRGVKSFIDNIVLPTKLFDDAKVTFVDVLDDVVNNSDHLAITCHVNLGCVTSIPCKVKCNYNYTKKYVWTNAAKQAYYYNTGSSLQYILESLSQNGDFNCLHADAIDNLYESIVHALKSSSEPYLCFIKHNANLKWSAYLGQLKNISRQAMYFWMENGCPNVGPSWDSYILSKRNYKRAVKDSKLNGKSACAARMLDAWNHGDSKNFWHNFNSNSTQSKCFSEVLNADMFVKQFQENFIDSSLNVQAHDNFANEFINYNCVNNNIDIEVEAIEKAVFSLNRSGVMDYDMLTINHFLYAHPVLFLLLKILFNVMITSGVAPDRFGNSVIFPIVKSFNKSIDDVGNYRPISIIPFIAKIFEACMQSTIDKLLSFHNNQFGFVKDGGCSKAIFTFSSCVRYFTERLSNVYFCSLDATKAFDRVNHFYLFNCMIERGFPSGLINVFKSWFRNMHSCVSWNNARSQFFEVRSGVPQGSILGGKFFNMLLDKLLCTLDSSGFGCYINSVFAGALAYADDLIIMSSSVVHLQKMLDMCNRFGIMCDLKFNVQKSCCGVIGKPLCSQSPDLLIDNYVLSWVDKFTYLGITFVTGQSLKVECKHRVQKFISSVCSVLRYKVAGYETVFAEILKMKCLPILFYGLECYMLDSQSMKSITQAWNMSFKWLFNYRKYDSTRLLFLSNNTMSLSFLLDQKMLCFYNSLEHSNNKLIHNLLTYMLTVHNVVELYRRYNLLFHCVVACIKRNVFGSFMEYCAERL
jgi:Reverse transcriptase (RNA-dependent DNA polymerase)